MLDSWLDLPVSNPLAERTNVLSILEMCRGWNICGIKAFREF